MQLVSPAGEPRGDDTTAEARLFTGRSSSLYGDALTRTYGLILYTEPSIPGVLQLLQGFIVMQWKHLNHNARREQSSHCRGKCAKQHKMNLRSLMILSMWCYEAPRVSEECSTESKCTRLLQRCILLLFFGMALSLLFPLTMKAIQVDVKF